jgi:hypothetical protein
LNDHIELLSDGAYLVADGRLAHFTEHDLAPVHIPFIPFLDDPRDFLLDAAAVDINQNDENDDRNKARDERDEEKASAEFFRKNA